MIINKPPSIPVHVCGAYYYNSIVKILKFDYGISDIYPLHRLDRLTSGLLMFGK